MIVWVYTLVSVIVVSALSLIGVFFLSLKQDRLNRILLFLVSFAVGGLFGDAFIHLLPQSYEKLGTHMTTSLYVIAGILLFFVVEKFVRWRHCHIPTSTAHPHPVVTMNLIGDSVHNLIDGMIIGASYSISTTIGIATTLAVVLHEIPQEVGDFGVLVHGGLSIKRALLFNFLTGLTAVIGALLSLVIGPYVKDYSVVLLPITAGGFIYIAGSDLIPELHHCEEIAVTVVQFASIVMGVLIMALLLFLE